LGARGRGRGAVGSGGGREAGGHSAAAGRRMIILMATPRRPQQRYDHGLRALVRATGNVTLVMDLGVPRSTARGWLRKTPAVVVGLDGTDLRTSELQQEIVGSGGA